MARYRMAGLGVEMAPTYPLLTRQAKPYLEPEAPLDIRLELTAAELDEILRTVPVYHMTCTISEEAVRVSYEAMSGQKYSKR